MTVAITREAKSLNDVVLDALNGVGHDRPQKFWTEGNSTQTVFPIKAGFYPSSVYVDGLLKREGVDEHYTVTFDGVNYSVVFDLAPVVVSICFECWRT